MEMIEEKELNLRIPNSLLGSKGANSRSLSQTQGKKVNSGITHSSGMRTATGISNS
jgi:hypothetical protein